MFENIALGTIFGTFGFFGCKMMEIPEQSQALSSVAFSLALGGGLYVLPSWNAQNHKSAAIVLSILATEGLGFALKYGLNAPDYVINPFLVGLMCLMCGIAAALNKRQPLTEYEVRELASVALEEVTQARSRALGAA